MMNTDDRVGYLLSFFVYVHPKYNLQCINFQLTTRDNIVNYTLMHLEMTLDILSNNIGPKYSNVSHFINSPVPLFVQRDYLLVYFLRLVYSRLTHIKACNI